MTAAEHGAGRGPQRYAIDWEDGLLVNDENGSVVRFKDHQAYINAEAEEVERNLTAQCDELRAGYERLESERDQLLADRARMEARIAELTKALAPLKTIADCYDANDLDDEARKTWGMNDEYSNSTPPGQIELYNGRGGRRLLTLQDCLAARAAIGKDGASK